MENIYKIRRFSRDNDYDLEDYEDLDDKKISKMTDNQKRMLLDDERQKAKRNRSKIISKHTKERGEEGAREGFERGQKTGKKVGKVIGAIGGAVGGSALGSLAHESLNEKLPNALKGKGGKAAMIGTGALAIGAGSSYLGGKLGKYIGGKNGESEGREEGQAKGHSEGVRKAKELGHDEIDHTMNTAKKFDEYARKHKGDDKWEVGFRDKLKQESKDHQEKAEKARREEIERRKAAAEERRAMAEERRANTDRARYWDDVFNDKPHYYRY